MKRYQLTTLAAAFCITLGATTGAIAMNKSEYKLAKDDITMKFGTEKSACKPLAGNAKDICMEEAKGHEKIARAELEENYSPSKKHSIALRLAKADAAYAVAKEKCDDLNGNAKDVCVKEAKAALVSAKADAKVAEKTAEATATAHEKNAAANATAHEKVTEARHDAAADKREAAYSVAKEKCDALSGDAKAGCLAEAKMRFGQS